MPIERPPASSGPLRLVGAAAPSDSRPLIVYAAGARAELIAAAPVIAELRRGGAFRQAVVRTGTDDPRALDLVARDLGLTRIDHDLGIVAGRHAEETAAVLSAFEALLMELTPDLVVVAGDSDASLAAALAAGKLDIALARLDAGLRGGDWTQSGEVNRVLSDRLCDTLLAPDEDAAAHLLAEGIPDGRVHLTGATGVDALRRAEPAARARAAWGDHGLEPDHYVLAELHTAATLEDSHRLAVAVRALIAVAAHTIVVLPVSTRMEERLSHFGQAAALRGAGVLCPPVGGYLDALSLRMGAGAIVTDAGDVQDDACALGIRCFTLGATTERQTSVLRGNNILLGDDPSAIAAVRPSGRPPVLCAVPLWDGRAAQRAAETITAHYSLIPATTEARR